MFEVRLSPIRSLGGKLVENGDHCRVLGGGLESGGNGDRTLFPEPRIDIFFKVTSTAGVSTGKYPHLFHVLNSFVF